MILLYHHKRFSSFLVGVALSLALMVLLTCVASLVLIAPAYAAGFPIVDVLHSGARPEAMAVDTQTHLLYIAHESPGLVVAFNAVRGQVVWRVTLGDVATDVQVDSASHVVFVMSSSYSRNESDLFVLSGATGQILAKLQTGSGDNGMAFDATRHHIYVSSDGVINEFTTPGQWQDSTTAFQTIQASTLHIGTHPQGLGVNTRLGRLYVADISEHVLRVVDEPTLHVQATIPVGNAPLHPLRVDEKTGYVYVVCSTSQELDVIDGNKNAVIARIPVAPYPEGITIDTATGRIYIADEGNNEQGNSNKDSGNTMTVVDGKTFQLLGTLHVGAAPDGVASDPALHLVYVALEDSNAVAEVSDSVNLPLQINETLNQAIDARHAIGLLQQASIVTALLMLTTVGVATFATYERNRKMKARIVAQERQHVMESPRTEPGDASSLAERHSLRS